MHLLEAASHFFFRGFHLLLDVVDVFIKLRSQILDEFLLRLREKLITFGFALVFRWVAFLSQISG